MYSFLYLYLFIDILYIYIYTYYLDIIYCIDWGWWSISSFTHIVDQIRSVKLHGHSHQPSTLCVWDRTCGIEMLIPLDVYCSTTDDCIHSILLCLDQIFMGFLDFIQSWHPEWAFPMKGTGKSMFCSITFSRSIGVVIRKQALPGQTSSVDLVCLKDRPYMWPGGNRRCCGLDLGNL